MSSHLTCSPARMSMRTSNHHGAEEGGAYACKDQARRSERLGCAGQGGTKAVNDQHQGGVSLLASRPSSRAVVTASRDQARKVISTADGIREIFLIQRIEARGVACESE